MWRDSRRFVAEAILLPVEVLPELELDAVDDPRELLAVVVTRRPQLAHRAELRDVGEAVLGGLRHRHLVSEKAPVAVSRMDPEALRRLLRVEPRRLARRQPAEEEARGEADRARLRRHEVREVAERPQVAPPAGLGEPRAEVR